ncbi:MAG: molybdenum ABC transporter ATP-binding protein [Paracoccaceae bacterium]
MTALALDIRRGLEGFDLCVETALPLSGLTAIFGPSGAGKSTLLRAIAGFDRAATGRIAFGEEVWQDDDGRFVPPHRRGAAMVFQDARLFGHLSVSGNLHYAARRAPKGGPDMARAVTMFDLAALMPRRPATLSGGERQRVALARAYLSHPRLLLLDEPLSALDAARKAEILPFLERLRDAGGLPILYVSHSVAEVARLANRIVAMDHGRIVHAGPADQLLSDPGRFPDLAGEETGAVLTAHVLRHLDGEGLSELGFDGGSILVPRLPDPLGSRHRVRVRARDVLVALDPPKRISALNILPATVDRCGDAAGGMVYLRLAVGGEYLLARLTQRSVAALDLAPGRACHAILKSVALIEGGLNG